MELIFAHFVCKGSFGKIWVKITEWSIVLENFHLVFILNISFVHFEHEKNFWQIFVKFIVYNVFLLSSQSDKKQFQLVDFVIGHS